VWGGNRPDFVQPRLVAQHEAEGEELGECQLVQADAAELPRQRADAGARVHLVSDLRVVPELGPKQVGGDGLGQEFGGPMGRANERAEGLVFVLGIYHWRRL
jgi:hypothetical protein